jgi:uncharacterized lipoprotein YbaY
MPAGLNRAAILLVPLIAACGSSQPASDPTASPASKAASQPASPPATQPAAETRPSSDLVGVVWTSADPSAALGSFRIFLPDGTLVVDSCFETYRLSPWRQIGERRIEWAEDTARIEADIVELTPERLRLKLQLKSEVKEEAYRRTRAPFVCPDMPRGDPTSDTSSSVMRVEGTVTYSERLVLRPSAVVTVELRDTARADAPARTLATQRIPASQGPPFKFAFSVPAEKIDPKAALAVFATIREGVRLMFITDTRNAVPREGATDMDVQLMFVASAPGDRARAS